MISKWVGVRWIDWKTAALPLAKSLLMRDFLSFGFHEAFSPWAPRCSFAFCSHSQRSSCWTARPSLAIGASRRLNSILQNEANSHIQEMQSVRRFCPLRCPKWTYQATAAHSLLQDSGNLILLNWKQHLEDPHVNFDWSKNFPTVVYGVIWMSYLTQALGCSPWTSSSVAPSEPCAAPAGDGHCRAAPSFGSSQPHLQATRCTHPNILTLGPLQYADISVWPSVAGGCLPSRKKASHGPKEAKEHLTTCGQKEDVHPFPLLSPNQFHRPVGGDSCFPSCPLRSHGVKPSDWITTDNL